jgi:PAT family beta-lactamase induction signal transducer AmpG
MLICIFNGFSAGLPLFYLYHLIPAWLRDSNVDLKTIGLFSLVGIPYTYKFLWSPIMDRFVPPFLGRRRGWMLITQIALLVSMLSLSLQSPERSVWTIAYTAFAIAFFSASQDIVLDAYRRELLPEEELGLGNSFYMNGYRAAVFIPGGLGVALGDYLPWSTVHLIIASFMIVGICKTFAIKEVLTDIQPPRTFVDSVVKPFQEFFARDGVRPAFMTLLFLLLYKLGDNMATALSTPFYIDLGFDLVVIGSMVKLINVWAMLIGTFIGGIIIYKIGINKALWLFGVVQLLSILGFAVLAAVGNNSVALACVLGFEYLGVGLGATALTAYMARATNVNFTATQFALFSSLIAIPRTFANSITGFLIEGVGPKDDFYHDLLGTWPGMGYQLFFVFCSACALPGMILLIWVAPWAQQKQPLNHH